METVSRRIENNFMIAQFDFMKIAGTKKNESRSMICALWSILLLDPLLHGSDEVCDEI
jgi:hypothetical protein